MPATANDLAEVAVSYAGSDAEGASWTVPTAGGRFVLPRKPRDVAFGALFVAPETLLGTHPIMSLASTWDLQLLLGQGE